MTESPERYKVAYYLRFPKERLAELGPLCAELNLEVLHTNVAGNEVVALARAAPEDVDAVRTRLDADVRYESPKRLTRGVLVPTYETAESEIEARKVRASKLTGQKGM